MLVTLVDAYEGRAYDIPAPDPIQMIKYPIESRGLKRTDLEPYIGNRARLSEILNRRRPLTLNMIRQLSAGLGLPVEVLIETNELAELAGGADPWLSARLDGEGRVT